MAMFALSVDTFEFIPFASQISVAGLILAPRQLLSYTDVSNAENAGAFFCLASSKAPTVGALKHAILGVMQNLHMPSLAIRFRRQAYMDVFTTSFDEHPDAEI